MRHSPCNALRLALLLCLALTATASQADTRITSGGFLRLHLFNGGVSDSGRLRGDQQLFIPHINEGTASRGGTVLDARESRFWLRGTRTTDIGQIEALYEADLSETAASYQLRLRHAYLLINQRLLIGQSYSSFTNTAAIADADSGTAVGNVVTRHRMLRWRQPLNEQLHLDLSAEQPLNRFARDGQASFSSHASGRRPDLVLRLQYVDSQLDLALAGLQREISLRPAAGMPRQRRNGTAIGLSGRLHTGDLHNLRFMYNYGDVLARYATLGTYADAFVDEEQQLSLNTTRSVLLAYQHHWHPQWRSNLTLSQSSTSLPEAASGSLTQRARSAQLNLIWTPDSRHSLGIEYLRGERLQLDGRRSHLNRWQLTGRINFRHTLWSPP